MKHQQLSALIDSTFGAVVKLRESKGLEYSGLDDALLNFKRNATDCHCDPILIWRIYAGKHWDSLSTFVKDVNAGNERITSEPIEGRIDDLITYLILLKGLIYDRNLGRGIT